MSTFSPALAQEAATENAPAKPEAPAAVLNADVGIDELDLRLIPLTKPELESAAAAWLEIVRNKTEEVMSAEISVLRADGAAESAAWDALAALALERKALFDKYNKVISALEKKGGAADLVAEYRAYESAVVLEETRTADYETLALEAMNWAVDRDGGISFATKTAVIIATLIGLFILAGIARRMAQKWFGHIPNLSKLLQAFLATVVYWLVMAVGLLAVLSALGFDITPVFALIGGASFIMAFAFQDALGNLASGLMIMVNRPFDEGDYVDVGGVAGTVKSVSIVATTVTTPDNQIIVIPNKNVWGNVITNVTASATRRVDLVFGISYEDSIPDALRVIEETVSAHPLVLKDPETMIRVHELADSSVNFICRPWTKTSDYWTVYWDLMQQMKQNFDEAGISIPYPQQDLHVKNAALAFPPAAPES
ncbi:MAG: mechanosensitive ion channel domain-containing protein [Paracoccaceae bacterium]